jgi:hypothetical protein
MEEARQVIERLERIDALREAGASPDQLLDEVRGLLTQGERWLAAEKGEGTERARAAVRDVRACLAADERKVVAKGSL